MQTPEINLDPQCFQFSQKLLMVRKRGPDVKEYLRMAFDGADQPAVACSLQLNRRGVGLRFHPDNHRQQHDLPSGQLPSHHHFECLRQRWLRQRWLRQRWLRQRWLTQRWLSQWLRQQWLRQRWLSGFRPRNHCSKQNS